MIVKNKVLALLFLFFFTFCNAQNKSIKFAIKNLNKQLEVYQTLNPFGAEYYAIKDLKLTKAELKEAYGETMETTDSIENIEAMGFIQDRIHNQLDLVLKHKKAKTIDFTKVFNDNLAVIKSPDNKLYNFSIDEKTGGSYRSRISWMYYLLNGQFVNVDYSIEDETPPFNSDGYTEIKSFRTFNTTRYLLMGSVRGCGACFEEYVTLVHFEDDHFILDFEYSITSRLAEQRIFFDEDSRALSVFYETDDLTQDCYCENEDNSTNLNVLSDVDDQQTLICSCLFEFDGKTFRLSKRCSEFKKSQD